MGQIGALECLRYSLKEGLGGDIGPLTADEELSCEAGRNE